VMVKVSMSTLGHQSPIFNYRLSDLLSGNKSYIAVCVFYVLAQAADGGI